MCRKSIILIQGKQLNSHVCNIVQYFKMLQIAKEDQKKSLCKPTRIYIKQRRNGPMALSIPEKEKNDGLKSGVRETREKSAGKKKERT